MSFATAIRTCFGKYFRFSGRARRSEYWWFILFVLLGNIVAGALDGYLFGFSTIEYGGGEVGYESSGPLAALFSLITLIPVLSSGWRRMHDTGRSGLYLFYPLIVMIGIITFMGMVAGFGPVMNGEFSQIIAGGSAIALGIAVFVFFISPLIVLWWLTRPSDPDTNTYGPPPA